MMRAAIDPVHDQRHPVAQLVGQPLADHPPDDGLLLFLAVEHILAHPALKAPVGQRPVDRLHDVAALAQRPHRRLQLLGDGPDAGFDFPGETEALERLQPADPERPVEIGADLARLGAKVEHPVRRLLDHGAVDPGETLGGDLRPQLLAQLQVGLRSQLQGRPLLGAQAHAIGDVVLGDDQVFAEIVLAPDDDVAMRMAGVVVVDRHPIELGGEIGLHLGHHVAGEAAQIRQAVAILRRDDNAERMPVALAALDEGASVFLIALRAVELAALAVAGRSVPLKVAQMGAGRPASKLCRTIRALTTTRRWRVTP